MEITWTDLNNVLDVNPHVPLVPAKLLAIHVLTDTSLMVTAALPVCHLASIAHLKPNACLAYQGNT